MKNELDDFLCEIQSDEGFSEDELEFLEEMSRLEEQERIDNLEDHLDDMYNDFFRD